MTDQQRQARSDNLQPLLKSALGTNFTNDHLASLLDAEDEMTENREYLVVLHERGILSDNELSDKLNRCFEVFVRRAADILGDDVCRSIYDYGPGEKIDLVPNQTMQQVGKRYALLVGTARSRDSRLPTLAGVSDDVTQLQAYLSTHMASYNDVSVILDGSRQQIKNSLDATLGKVEPEDSVLFFFSGHGVQDDGGNLFLATEDTNLDSMAGSSLSAKDLSEAVGRCAGQVLVILDACNSGNPISEAALGSISAHHPATTSLLAAQWDNPEYEQNGSAFTDHLIRGLGGAADADSDGRIGFSELQDYLGNSITEETDETVVFVQKDEDQQDMIVWGAVG